MSGKVRVMSPDNIQNKIPHLNATLFSLLFFFDIQHLIMGHL